MLYKYCYDSSLKSEMKASMVQLLFHQTVYATWIFAAQVIYIDLSDYKGASKVDDEILMPVIFTFSLLNILMLTKKAYMETAQIWILIRRAIILCAASHSSLLLHA